MERLSRKKNVVMFFGNEVKNIVDDKLSNSYILKSEINFTIQKRNFVMYVRGNRCI